MTHWRNSPEAQAHRERCKALPLLSIDERDRLVAAYVAAKKVTECPARYVAPSQEFARYSLRIG